MFIQFITISLFFHSIFFNRWRFLCCNLRQRLHAASSGIKSPWRHIWSSNVCLQCLLRKTRHALLFFTQWNYYEYHQSMPVPLFSYEFSSTDIISQLTWNLSQKYRFQSWCKLTKEDEHCLCEPPIPQRQHRCINLISKKCSPLIVTAFPDQTCYENTWLLF